MGADLHRVLAAAQAGEQDAGGAGVGAGIAVLAVDLQTLHRFADVVQEDLVTAGGREAQRNLGLHRVGGGVFCGSA